LQKKEKERKTGEIRISGREDLYLLLKREKEEGEEIIIGRKGINK